MSGMSIQGIEEALIAWLKTVAPTGWVVTLDDQNAPKPGPLQIILRRQSPFIRKSGRDEYGPILDNGSRKILGTREMMFSIRALGPQSQQVAEDIRARLDDDTVEDVLVASQITVVQTGDVMNLTTLYASQFKEVGDFEVLIRTHSLRELNDAESSVGYIETVNLDKITNPGPSQTVDHIHVARP